MSLEGFDAGRFDEPVAGYMKPARDRQNVWEAQATKRYLKAAAVRRNQLPRNSQRGSKYLIIMEFSPQNHTKHDLSERIP